MGLTFESFEFARWLWRPAPAWALSEFGAKTGGREGRQSDNPTLGGAVVSALLSLSSRATTVGLIAGPLPGRWHYDHLRAVAQQPHIDATKLTLCKRPQLVHDPIGAKLTCMNWRCPIGRRASAHCAAFSSWLDLLEIPYTCVYAYIYLYACMYACMYGCVYLCMYVGR